MNESSRDVDFFGSGAFVAVSARGGGVAGERAATASQKGKRAAQRRTRRRDLVLPFFPKIISRTLAAGLARRKLLPKPNECSVAPPLRLVTQTFLMAILLHALATLVFGDLRFSTFLQGAHRGLISMPVSRSATQASDARVRNSSFIAMRGRSAPLARSRRVPRVSLCGRWPRSFRRRR